MKFMAFSDVHADMGVAERLVKRAQKDDIELVVCAGDFTVFERQLKPMLRLFDTIGKPVILIPGNHEAPKELEKNLSSRKHIVYAHKKLIRMQGITFLGWGTDGFLRYSDDFRIIARQWRQELTKDDQKIVLITHAPPFGTVLDKLENDYVGNKDIRQAIERIKPNISISGHIHENEGKKDTIGDTLCVNPGWKGMVLTL
ncbi:metallophosphoesterase family protein [Candidatus Woesearchaeota archaeon]|nr:metallophosphoesterase family protein [Candidatus Woesearchaeota archaeon]